MKIKLLLFLTYVLFFSCHVTHNHYINDIEYANKQNIQFSYLDKGDHIIVIVKHKRKLSYNQKQRLKRWHRKHHKRYKKNIKYKFVIK